MLNETLKNAVFAEGQVMRKMEKLLDKYYAVRGWKSNGIPSPEKLKSLGPDMVINDIEGVNNLREGFTVWPR